MEIYYLYYFDVDFARLNYIVYINYVFHLSYVFISYV